MTLLRLAPFHSFRTFKFPDPDTKFMHHAQSFEMLIHNIKFYRRQNELEELEYLESVVEHYLCQQKENIGACERRPQLKRGIIPFLKGGVLLLKNLLYNQFVSQEVADARSELCKTCPLNVFPDKGAFVRWSDELAVQTVGERKSKNHDALGTCEGCGCPLRCKVWYGGTIKLKPEEKEKILPVTPNCWQL